MVTAVRQLCAQQSLSTSTAFATDPEIVNRLNEALADLRDLIISVQGQEWASTTSTIAVDTTTGIYPLPADYDEMLGVRLEQGAWQDPILPWEYADVASLSNQAVSAYRPRDYRYRVKGTTTIVLLPTPAVAMTLYLDYIPAYTPLVNDTDASFEMPYGAWKWAELTAAIELLAKERIDSSALAMRLAAKERILLGKAKRRDRHAPRIKDTRRDGGASARYPRLVTSG